MKYKYKEGCLGGTFDHLHYGHQHFFHESFKLCYNIRIGLTDDGFIKEKLKKKHSEKVESFENRENKIKKHMEKSGYSGRYEIALLRDFYDPKLLDSECPIEVIFVTKETENTARSLNNEREKLGIEPLNIEVIGMVLAYDSKPISSTRIRSGEIDLYGAKGSRPTAS